jgi:hypothetical protein
MTPKEPTLFDANSNEIKSDQASAKPVRENEFEWRQFCNLGEMMGDGLHHEPGGNWISKEYRKLAKILLPESETEKTFRLRNNAAKAENINKQMAEVLAKKNCQCGGTLKQVRSGAKVACCQTCNAKYTAKYKKK